MTAYIPDPELDLVLERTLPVAPDRVWAAWTDPALLVQWFTPAPWKTVSADLDVRPGGRCITTMESPEGEQFPNAGCYLQVEPGSLLVFTSAMVEGFQVHLGGGLALAQGQQGGFGRKLRGLKTTAAELPDYVERTARAYAAQRADGETFSQWAVRVDEVSLR